MKTETDFDFAEKNGIIRWENPSRKEQDGADLWITMY